MSGALLNSIAIDVNDEKSVYDIEVPSITGSNSLVTIANSDKCPDISEDITSVTTAQLKDPDYLRSIGFLIQT